MKRITVTLAALALSATAYADISTGNSDLDGWVVEDYALLDVPQRPINETRPPFGTSEQYGGILFNPAPQGSTTSSGTGIGDSYGSVLRDVGFDW